MPLRQSTGRFQSTLPPRVNPHCSVGQSERRHGQQACSRGYTHLTMAKGGAKTHRTEPSSMSWALWFMAHPTGQAVMLVCVSIPVGIYSLVLVQNSYDALDNAVGAFLARGPLSASYPLRDPKPLVRRTLRKRARELAGPPDHRHYSSGCKRELPRRLHR